MDKIPIEYTFYTHSISHFFFINTHWEGERDTHRHMTTRNNTYNSRDLISSPRINKFNLTALKKLFIQKEKK